MSNEETCVRYFTSTTQNDIPVRQINRLNYQTNLSETATNPCNTWICDTSATEYDCMGITYTPIIDSSSGVSKITGYTSSYKTLDEWTKVWEDGSCLNLFQKMVQGYGSNQSTVAFSSSNFVMVQQDFNFMFSRYFNQDPDTQYIGATGTDGATGNPCVLGNETKPTWNSYNSNYGGTGDWYQIGGKFSNADNNCNVWINAGNTITVPGGKGYQPFLDTLMDACYNIPGACSETQEYMCDTCNREQIYVNPALTKFCGCSSSATTGNEFYNSDLQNFDPVCDPLCNRLDTIKYNNPTTGITKQCNANVCVIDAVQINSLSSSGITPTFNQVCPACSDGNGNCICIIDATFNTTIPSVRGENGEGSLNNQPKFEQYCPDSQCYRVDPYTNQYVPVACSDTLPKGNGPEVEIPWKFALICLFILLVVILVIFAYKYQSNNTPIYKVSSKYYQY
jgi:hypothetical protein